MERIPVTPEGYEAIRKELEKLKRVERPANIRAIEEARAHGDLSENAEYAAAKDRQSFIEGRIGELEYKLGNLEVIDPTRLPRDRAVFGSRVLLENIDTGQETWNISSWDRTSPTWKRAAYRSSHPWAGPCSAKNRATSWSLSARRKTRIRIGRHPVTARRR